MTNLLSIGRFAQITRISIRMLRHYDGLGLLRPAHVDEASGYRYYSLSQAPEAERIRLLRSLDMPLNEIRELLLTRDPEVLRARLARHRARLESQVAHYREALAALDRMEPSRAYPIGIRDVEPQPYLGRRVQASMSEIGQAMGEAFVGLHGILAEHGIRPVGPPFAQFHSDTLGSDLDYEVGLPVARRLATGELPGGQVAFALHTGAYSAVGPVYQALSAWLQEQDREVGRLPREVYLVGPGQTDDPAGYRTEVVWPLGA